MIRQLLDVAAVRIHDVDVEVAVTVTGKRDPGAVGRPGGINIAPRIVCPLPDVAAVRVHDVEVPAI